MEKSIVLFGMGNNGKRLLEILLNTGTSPTFLVDNNYADINDVIYLEPDGEKTVFNVDSPDVLLSKDKNQLGIIITPDSPIFEEIEAQVIEMGLVDCVVDKSDVLNNGSKEKSLNDIGFILPGSVSIDACTLCQLNCRTCFMRTRDDLTVGAGYMKFSNFKSFVDKNPYIKNIEFSCKGEMFLNPELLDIIIYAHDQGIRLTAYTGANFNTVSEEIIDALVKYKFIGMTIAIDGASPETYSAYRRNGDFNTVIENIRKLNNQKTLYNSEFPKLVWQYVIMESNENDVVRAKQMAEQLNMEIMFKLTWDKDYKPKNKNMLLAETRLQFLTRDEYAHNNPAKLPLYAPCNQLWTSPYINWDCRLLGCCNAITSDFGINVFESGLEEALHSVNYRYAKQMLLGELQPPCSDEHNPCVSCGIYKSMLEKNCFLPI